MAMEDQHCFLNDLPDEVLLKIFTKLPLSDLLLSARPVCQRWLRLSKDESLWAKVDLSTLFLGSEYTNRAKNTTGVEALLYDVQDCVERIIFNNVPLEGVAYELFCRSSKNALHICFQKLKSLDYSYSSVNVCQMRRALSTYPSITELILIHTNIILTDVVTEVVHLPCLKKLIFHDTHAWESFLDQRQDLSRMIDSKTLTKVPKHCSQLKWIELYTLRAVFDDDVIRHFIQCCPQLERMYFTWSTQLTDAAFQSSRQGNCVTHLGLADRHGQGAYLTSVLPHFPHLVSLTVEGHQVYQEDCISIGTCCPNLQELTFDERDLRDPINIFNIGLHQASTFLCSMKLQEIAQHCKYLRKVYAPCSKVDDDGFLFLVKHCPLLEDINFMCCPKLTVACLHVLSKHSHNLRFVNFQYTFETHEHLYVLLVNCPRLQDVILDRKISNTDKSLHNPSLWNSSSSLSPQSMFHSGISLPSNTPDNDNIEDLPFIDMFNSLDSESSLLTSNHLPSGSLSASASFNSETSSKEDIVAAPNNFIMFPVLSNHCHITTLSLKDTNISSGVLQQIFQLCPDLTHIDLDGCLGLKDETIHTLTTHCQNVKVLMISARENCPCHIGDEALRDLCKFSRNLETVSILNNRNISQRGICGLLGALDSSLRQLRSLSFCVGANYRCKMPLPEVHWLKYLSKRSTISLEEATGSRESCHFRILHLEFICRRI